MNWKTISMFVLGLCGIGYAVINEKAETYAIDTSCSDAVANRPTELTDKLEKAKERCKQYDILKKQEDTEFDRRLKIWKNLTDYDFKRASLKKDSANELYKFKQELGYFDQVDKIKSDNEAAIEAFKSSISYDSKKEELEDAIEAAEDLYEEQKKLFDNAGDKLSEVAMKLRHAAEEEMNTSVKKAKSELETLEQSLKTETAKLNSEMKKKLRDLEEKVEQEKNAINKHTDKELNRLTREFDSAKNDILNEIIKDRSPENVEVINKHVEDLEFVEEQEKADKLRAVDILDSKTRSERIAAYLKNKKVPKTVVILGASIPLFPVGYFIVKYIKFVFEVVKEM